MPDNDLAKSPDKTVSELNLSEIFVEVIQKAPYRAARRVQVSLQSLGTSVGIAPSVASNPSDSEVTEPDQVILSISASGTSPLSYQWQISVSGGAFADIGGATLSTLTLDPTAISMSGNRYRVVVTNAYGSVTSNPAELTVNEVPAPLALSMGRTTNTDVVSWSAVSSPAGNGTVRYKWDDADTATGGSIAVLASGPFDSPSLTPGKHWLYIEEQDGEGGYLPMQAKQVDYWTPAFGVKHVYDTASMPDDVDNWDGKFRVTTSANQIRGTTESNSHVCRRVVAGLGTGIPTVLSAIVQPVGPYTRFHWGTNDNTNLATFDLSGEGSVVAGSNVFNTQVTRLSQDFYYVQFRIALDDGNNLDIRLANDTSNTQTSFVSDPSHGLNVWDAQAVLLSDFLPATESITIQPTTTQRQTFLGAGAGLGYGSAPAQYDLLDPIKQEAIRREVKGTVDAIRCSLFMAAADPVAEFISDYITSGQLADFLADNPDTDVLVVASGIAPDNAVANGSGGITFAPSTDSTTADHGRDLADFIVDLRNAGVPVTHVDVINEPDVSTESSNATPDHVVRIIKAFKAQIDTYALADPVKIVAPSTSSHNGLGASATSSLEAYLDAIIADPVALAAVDNPSAHTYGLGMQDTFIAKMQQIGNEWQTEAGATFTDENNIAYPNGHINGCSYAARFINDVDKWCERWFAFIGWAQTDNDFPNTRDADHALWRYDTPTQTFDPRPQAYYIEMLNKFKGATILEWTAPVEPANALDAWRFARRPWLWPLVAQKPGGGVIVALLNFTSAMFPEVDPGGASGAILPYHARNLDVTLDLSNLSGLLASDEAVTITTLGGELTPMGHPQVNFEPSEFVGSLSGFSLTASIAPCELLILETA